MTTYQVVLLTDDDTAGRAADIAAFSHGGDSWTVTVRSSANIPSDWSSWDVAVISRTLNYSVVASVTHIPIPLLMLQPSTFPASSAEPIFSANSTGGARNVIRITGGSHPTQVEAAAISGSSSWTTDNATIASVCNGTDSAIDAANADSEVVNLAEQDNISSRYAWWCIEQDATVGGVNVTRRRCGWHYNKNGWYSPAKAAVEASLRWLVEAIDPLSSPHEITVGDGVAGGLSTSASKEHGLTIGDGLAGGVAATAGKEHSVTIGDGLGGNVVATAGKEHSVTIGDSLAGGVAATAELGTAHDVGIGDGAAGGISVDVTHEPDHELTIGDSGSGDGRVTITNGSSIVVSGVASTAVVGQPTLEPGAITVQISAIADTDTVGQPDLVIGSVNIGVDGLINTNQIGLPTPIVGAPSVSINGFTNFDTFGGPTITYGVAYRTIAGLPSHSTIGQARIRASQVRYVEALIDITIGMQGSFHNPRGKRRVRHPQRGVRYIWPRQH